MDPEALKLAAEIESSRQEIEKLQERVRQLVARRGKRAELVKSTHMMSGPELPPEAASIGPATSVRSNDDSLDTELTLDEGLSALKSTTLSEVRLIAFKHGAIVLLFANEKTLSIRMDDRGPKPVLDLLTANDHRRPSHSSPSSPSQARA